MTHPTLGYANFRFAGDDAVHLPATPKATMTVACNAGDGPLDQSSFPYEVDAPITCPNCHNAVEADWWMAAMENERRTGEVSSLTGTLTDVDLATRRLLSQTDAVIEETILGGGASMIESAHLSGRPQEPLGVLGFEIGFDEAQPSLTSQDVVDAMRKVYDAPQFGPPEPIHPEEAKILRGTDAAFSYLSAFWDPDVQKTRWAVGASPWFTQGPPRGRDGVVEVTSSEDYLFAQDRVTFKARQGDAKAYEVAQNPVTPEKLNDVMESLARQLAHSPLADLRRAQIHRGEWDAPPAVAKEGPWTGEAPLVDPGAERVRQAIEAAQQELAAHPFDEKGNDVNDHDAWVTDSFDGDEEDEAAAVDEVEFTHGGEVVVVDDGEHDYPDRNWCHVHNQQSLDDSELCERCAEDSLDDLPADPRDEM